MNTVIQNLRTCNTTGCTSQALLHATADIERVFGYRVSHGSKIPQAKCKECRRKKPDAGAAQNDAQQGEQSYLDALAAIGAIPGLIGQATDLLRTDGTPYPSGEEYQEAMRDGEPERELLNVKSRSAGATQHFAALRPGLQPLPPSAYKETITPRAAANMLRLCTTSDREDNHFSVALRAHCGLYVIPDMEEAAMPEERGYYYNSRRDKMADCNLERQLSDFLLEWAQAFKTWVDREEANRATIQKAIKVRDEKEKEKKRLKKQKDKARAKAAGKRYVDHDEDDEDGDDE